MLNVTNHQGNANQNHLSEWLSSKRTQITSIGEDVEKREPLYTLVGMEIGAATVENSTKISQKN